MGRLHSTCFSFREFKAIFYNKEKENFFVLFPIIGRKGLRASKSGFEISEPNEEPGPVELFGLFAFKPNREV